MPVAKLKEFLDANRVKYVCIIHSPAYTSQEIAAAAHVSAKQMAKTVIVKLDGKMAMAVLPAHRKVDLEALGAAAGTEDVSLASEEEFGSLFPGCELGAMPPFGNLYGMEVFESEQLTLDKEIAFNAGTHSELIQLAHEDFARLVRPRAIKLSC